MQTSLRFLLTVPAVLLILSRDMRGGSTWSRVYAWSDHMEHLSEILSFIGGLLSGFTLKIVIDRSSKNKVNQTGNAVGGDMAGRDIHKK